VTFTELKTGISKVFTNLFDDNATLIAAGMAYYFLLSIFPVLAASVLLYGLVFSPADISEQLHSLEGMVPTEMLDVLSEHLGRISQESTSAGLGLVLSLGIAVWGGSKAAKAQMMALNIAYGEKETRSFFHKMTVSLGLTVGSIVATLVAIAVVVFLPVALSFLPLPLSVEWTISVVRWLLLIILFMVGLSVFYRFAPDRKPPEWKWVTPGAVVVTFFWIAASIGFSWYVSRFGSFNETYGSFGAAILFLFWLFITALFIVLGAEINEEVERQRRDRGEEGEASADGNPSN